MIGRHPVIMFGKSSFFPTDIGSGWVHGWSAARKVAASYTGNCMRVQRVSDNLTDLVGYVNNELDTADVTTFCAGTDGGMFTLFDNIGARDLTGGAALTKPRIVIGGTLQTSGGKPFMAFDGSDDIMQTTTATPIMDGDSTVFVVFESQSGATAEGVFCENESGSNNRIGLLSNTQTTGFIHSNYRPVATSNTIAFGSQQPASTRRVFALRRTGNLVEGFDKNGLVGSITSADAFALDTLFTLGTGLPGTGGQWFSGKMVEALVNGGSMSDTDKDAVIANITNFYTI